MGLLTSSSSFLRYKIDDDQKLSSEKIRICLKENQFPEFAESEMTESIAGWVSYENHFDTDFEFDPIKYGNYFVFCLRIDKKSIPKKIIDKHLAIESKKIMKEANKDYLSKNEKSKLKEDIILRLSLQMPSIPDIYDILWIPEKNEIIFFTTQKTINEIFETLFRQTFKTSIIRLFPYTKVYFNDGISDTSKDVFYTSSHINIWES
ncbi:MAG: recombination-associated protein RdgC [Desulforegulaceae bacterium]|nr:recombination-associated protein RdgC [Desulforegulaceae bacterium]